jgi:hypothetical protein
VNLETISESSQSEKATLCDSTYISVQTRQAYGHRKQICGCQGLEERVELSANGYRFFLGRR